MGVKLKTLSGSEVLAILERFGFVGISQNGSHAKLRRMTIAGSQTLIVPLNNPLPKGTLKAIFSQASRYVPQENLHEYFYTSQN